MAQYLGCSLSWQFISIDNYFKMGLLTRTSPNLIFTFYPQIPFNFFFEKKFYFY